MSWSTGTKAVAKIKADEAIDALTLSNQEDWHDDQLRIAKLAAKMILLNIPGPFVIVSLHGHGNGVGWNKKDGWASDSITVTVTQMFEETKP
jgi:hypothetical protein